MHIRDNLQLKSNEYSVVIKGVDVAKDSIMMGRILAMNPGTTEQELDGIKTTEPTFGLPAVWIPSTKKQEAQLAGFTVVDPATVITTHIKETIKRHAHELLGRQETQALLDKFKETNPKVVEELIPNLLSLGNPVGANRPACARLLLQGPRSVNVRVRSPCLQLRPSAS